MSKSVFNPEEQNLDISSKIVVGLQRVSEAFKVLLWEKAKLIGLSPIQIQLLIFISYHKAALCNVSHLAKEFNVTKPTISDAIKALDKKKLVFKDHCTPDSRSYLIRLSELGKIVVLNINDFSGSLHTIVKDMPEYEQESFYKTLSTVIYKLNKDDILQEQRTCFTCKFYSKNDSTHYCNLLNKQLYSSEIRLDCSEFENEN